MIILCGVCTVQTVFAPSFSAEQSVHCVMCRAAAVIMAIMSSPGQNGSFFYGENQRSQTGREKEEGKDRGRADLLHSCRVGWICEEWREKKGNTHWRDLFTFAYLYQIQLFSFPAHLHRFRVHCFHKSLSGKCPHNVQPIYSR